LLSHYDRHGPRDMTSPPVALITGSGKKRVGWHVADALAKRGYRLARHYRTSAAEAAETERELRGRGNEVVAIQADLADEASVRALVAQTLDRFGLLGR